MQQTQFCLLLSEILNTAKNRSICSYETVTNNHSGMHTNAVSIFGHVFLMFAC